MAKNIAIVLSVVVPAIELLAEDVGTCNPAAIEVSADAHFSGVKRCAREGF